MIRTLLIAIAVVALAAPVLALDYWPDDPDGLIYRYRSIGSGSEFDAQFDVDPEYHHVSWTHGICTGGETYAVNAASVGLAYWTTYCQGAIDPDFNWLGPPMDVVYDGMADGDAWTYVGEDVHDTCIIIVTVASETVTVPMGTFETLHVHLQYILCGYAQIFDYWLDRDLGPVRINDSELVSIDGPVATVERTWSRVKSLYR